VTTTAPHENPNPTPDAAASGTWQLGDRTIHRLGFGAMRLTGTGAFHNGTPRDRDASIAVVRRAVELGVNHIDTAQFYFSALRSANEIVNAALAPFGADEVLVATKVGPRRDRAGGWEDSPRPEDLVYLRYMRWDSIGERFAALAELREAGLIRHLGVSGVTVEQLHEARAIAPVVSVQNKFGLDDTASLDLMRTCGELGIAFVPFFAMAGARDSDLAKALPAELEEDPTVLKVAEAHGVSAPQIRLAWTLAQGPHVLAIPGTGDAAHLEANVAAGAIRLTAEDLAALAAR
jgi:aryl-alcohol dehydrogenase-like predicted oxidoreductase